MSNQYIFLVCRGGARVLVTILIELNSFDENPIFVLRNPLNIYNNLSGT